VSPVFANSSPKLLLSPLKLNHRDAMIGQIHKLKELIIAIANKEGENEDEF